MHDWQQIIVNPNASVYEVIETIDKGGVHTALIVDEQHHLLGIVTDGDIRRALLRHVSMEEKIQHIMRKDPVVAKPDTSDSKILDVMREKTLFHIPLIDEQGIVVGLKSFNEFLNPNRRDNTVVLMAGGLGERLGALTAQCPKPLLDLKGKPILHILIDSLKEYGFHNIYISVNYKSEMIIDYFGDGSDWGININYLRETKRLGTAGPLQFLPEELSLPIIVINADLLTDVNYASLLNFHAAHHAEATMCVRKYDFQVPYGVVDIKDSRIFSIDEKPVHRFFVNAGIYVLNPSVLPFIPKDTFYDMPNLFQEIMQRDMITSAFPIREYWKDIGRLEDYECAGIDYQKEVFI